MGACVSKQTVVTTTDVADTAEDAAKAPHGAANESSEDQAAADIANAVSTERVAYFRRLGMNRREVRV